ncbi:MAG: flagellar biosynthesis protein FliS [Peptococcaceae bacterium BRH_c4b]|nr:MAG: flagellar biosynthesis protein FliS [Peptococcaceae bacterium BRH_c4b]
MALANPYQQYKANSINSASPGELTLMLFNGVIKFIKAAIAAVEEKTYEKVNENLISAQDIISYLSSTLNMNYEIAKNLSSLYDFMYSHLVTANIKKDGAAMKEVAELIEGLRDAWAEMLKQNNNQG